MTDYVSKRSGSGTINNQISAPASSNTNMTGTNNTSSSSSQTTSNQTTPVSTAQTPISTTLASATQGMGSLNLGAQGGGPSGPPGVPQGAVGQNPQGPPPSVQSGAPAAQGGNVFGNAWTKVPKPLLESVPIFVGKFADFCAVPRSHAFVPASSWLAELEYVASNLGPDALFSLARSSTDGNAKRTVVKLIHDANGDWNEFKRLIKVNYVESRAFGVYSKLGSLFGSARLRNDTYTLYSQREGMILLELLDSGFFGKSCPEIQPLIRGLLKMKVLCSLPLADREKFRSHVGDDKIKTASVEELVRELEDFLISNSSHLITPYTAKVDEQMHYTNLGANSTSIAVDTAASRPVAVAQTGSRLVKDDIKPEDGNNEGRSRKKGFRCYSCNKEGHYSKDCMSRPRSGRPSYRGHTGNRGRFRNRSQDGNRFRRGNRAHSREPSRTPSRERGNAFYSNGYRDSNRRRSGGRQ